MKDEDEGAIQKPHGSFFLIESRGGIFEFVDISTQPVAAIYDYSPARAPGNKIPNPNIEIETNIRVE